MPFSEGQPFCLPSKNENEKKRNTSLFLPSLFKKNPKENKQKPKQKTKQTPKKQKQKNRKTPKERPPRLVTFKPSETFWPLLGPEPRLRGGAAGNLRQVEGLEDAPGEARLKVVKGRGKNALFFFLHRFF